MIGYPCCGSTQTGVHAPGCPNAVKLNPAMKMSEPLEHRFLNIHYLKRKPWGKGGVRCHAKEATHVTVSAPGFYPEWEFEWPTQRHAVEKLIRLVDKAIERGKQEKVAEIKATLKL